MKPALASGTLLLLVVPLDFLVFLLAWQGLLRPPWADPLLCSWLLAMVRYGLLSLLAYAALSYVGHDLPRAIRSALFPGLALLSFLTPSCTTLQYLLLPRGGALELVHSWARADVFALNYGIVVAVAFLWYHLLPPEQEKAQKKPSASFWRLLCSLKPEAFRFVAILGLLLLSSLGEMALPYYTGQMTDWIVTETGFSTFQKALWLMSLFTVVSIVAEFLCDCLYNMTMNRFHTRFQSTVYRSVLRQEIGFFHANQTGDITSRITTDTEAMSEALTENLSLLMWYFVRGVFLYTMMMRLSVPLALLITVALPFLLLPKISDKFHQNLAQEVQVSLMKANEVAVELFQAISTVRSFANEDGAAWVYEEKLQKTYKLNKWEAVACAVSTWTSNLSRLAVKVGLLYFGGHLVTLGKVSSGELVTFILYEMEFSTVVQVLLEDLPKVQKTVGSSEKIFEYIDRTPKILSLGTWAPENLRGHVVLRNISFSYPGKENSAVLKGVSLELQPGMVTALVGPSGAGKSSMVALLKHFFEPQEGQVLLDGRDLSDYEPHFLHQKVALVSQKPVLFHRSLFENITYGVGKRSHEEVTEAVLCVGVHHFIARMNQGYDTDAGDAGSQISGGQRQGVTIARALIRDPRVLILDDATSALDTESQQQVEKEIYDGAARSRRSVLFISHHLQSVERADLILVMEDGEIRERGTHAELMEKRGTYWQLVKRLQNGD